MLLKIKIGTYDGEMLSNFVKRHCSGRLETLDNRKLLLKACKPKCVALPKAGANQATWKR